MVADADRQLRRADAAARHLLERLLRDAVLQRVEGDDRDAPARLQVMHRRAERLLEDAELVVDLDADGLEDALRRMAAGRLAHRLRHRLADDVDELARPLDGLYGALPDDELRDAAPPALLAVIVEDAVELLLAVRLDDIVRRELRLRIHAHVERRIVHIREAALRRVDLVRRDTEVKDDAVDERCPLRLEDLLEMREIAVHDVDVALDVLEALFRRRDGLLILIDADNAALRREQFRDAMGMASASQSTVDIDPFFICHETLDRLLQHDADMMKLHVSFPHLSIASYSICRAPPATPRWPSHPARLPRCSGSTVPCSRPRCGCPPRLARQAGAA